MTKSLVQIPILPTTVYQRQVPTNLYVDLVHHCQDITWGRTQDESRSLSIVRDKPAFVPIIDWINSCVADVFNEVYTDPVAQGLEVSDIWLNRAERGEETHYHNHPWSIISGVVYITGNDGDTTFVHKNPYDTINEMPMSRKYQTSQEIPTGNGTIVMFPSTLHHYVPPNNADVVRHTLSFNTMPTSIDDGHLISWYPKR